MYIYCLFIVCLLAQIASSNAIVESDWEVEYDGYGYVEFGDGQVHFAPMNSTQSDETHAVLILSKTKYQSFDIEVTARTDRQLREGDDPNTWEVFWTFFNYMKTTGFEKEANYFILKTNGIELGTADKLLGQNFLVTDSQPICKIGKDYTYRIKMSEDFLLSIWIDDTLVIDNYKADQDDSSKSLYKHDGYFGLYTEDGEITVKSFKDNQDDDDDDDKTSSSFKLQYSLILFLISYFFLNFI
ncbi:hypothetical protein M0812_06943 [Anaeramoeba flamelloides]|uniref:Uncharacterized protein n=1 Tax=Anaeramoeba flamelloides TaxID=1746091 RepID=A0AAV8ABF8_9EUKA|nr:hypothetical protein M0812_06943 [Anaeramoeba flamelloides]